MWTIGARRGELHSPVVVSPASRASVKVRSGIVSISVSPASRAVVTVRKIAVSIVVSPASRADVNHANLLFLFLFHPLRGLW